MTAKQEIIAGMRGVIDQSRRVSALLDQQGDWDVRRPTGWTPKEMFCHLAIVGGWIASSGPELLSAPEDSDFTANNNVTELNERSVAAMKDMTPPQLTQAIALNFGKVIDFVEGIPDERFQEPMTFAQMKMPVNDFFGNIGVLHANHHLFEAALRTAF